MTPAPRPIPTSALAPTYSPARAPGGGPAVGASTAQPMTPPAVTPRSIPTVLSAPSYRCGGRWRVLNELTFHRLMAENDEANAGIESTCQHSDLGPGFGLRLSVGQLNACQQSRGEHQGRSIVFLHGALFVVAGRTNRCVVSNIQCSRARRILSSREDRGSSRRPAAAGMDDNRVLRTRPPHRQQRRRHLRTSRREMPSGGRRPQTTTASAAGR